MTQNSKDEKKLPRAKYSTENQNSIGILLFQGDKKALFAGDMNDLGKIVNGERIGDEDRLKKEIGKIDLFKANHHGYSGSNTSSFWNTLSPNYVIIINDVGEPYELYLNRLYTKKVNYIYSTQDEYEVCSIIYNDEITLWFGTSGIKKVKNVIFYIPENKIYSDYLKCKYKVKYEYIEKSVNNWDEKNSYWTI